MLVALFQRGAMDGLAAVQPVGDARLSALRPGLMLPPSDLLGLGAAGAGGHALGLHPALAPLLPFFHDGRLAIVHGAGSPTPTRSHFDAQDYMELGTPDRKSTPTGWLTRAAGALGHDATPFQRVAIADTMPRSLAGDDRAIALASLDALTLGDTSAEGATGADRLEDLYRAATANGPAGRSGSVEAAGRGTVEAARILDRVRREVPRGEGYPPTPLGRSLEQIARLIRADVGVEVAMAETGGWDTHVGQGAARGTFARQASDLARSVAAFHADLGPLADEVVVLTMTEFGRTVGANGSGGTDHGRASAMFVLGNSVNGGRVVGSLPDRFERDALADGRDLPVTTDFRALFGGVAGGHLGIDTASLFPGYDGPTLDVVRR